VAALVPLSALSSSPQDRPKALNDRVLAGRLSELSGHASSGRTTAAVSLVIRAQLQDEPVAWVQPEGGTLYPPDLAESGIDLDALLVVHAPGGRRGARNLARAAELLLRSGAFGLVVLDLTSGAPRGDAWQGRLSALARQHDCRVVLLSEADEHAPSLGPMVGLRVVPVRERRAPGRFVVEHRVLKDKLGKLDRPLASDRRRAPWGLS
jgi:recombination protein RecA